MSIKTLTELSVLSSLLFKDEGGNYAVVLDVHRNTVDFQLDGAVTVTVETTQLPFKVKPGQHVYFDADFVPEAVTTPSTPAVETATAKKTQGAGSLMQKGQVW